MLYRVPLAWTGFELTTLVVICTDCIGSYRSNYHTITTTTPPILFVTRSPYEYIINTEFFIKTVPPPPPPPPFFVRVGILLTCGKYLHDRIMSLRGAVWVNKNSLTPLLLLKSLCQVRKNGCHVFVLGISILSLSTIS
jgi:hypothetical protein